MNGSDSSGAVAAARHVVTDARRAFTLPHRDVLAICSALVEAENNPVSQVTDALADAARALIAAEAEHTMAKGPDGYAPLKVGLAREMAFLTFKARFEQEFPND